MSIIGPARAALTAMLGWRILSSMTYAARAGKSVEQYLEPMGPLLTPEIAGDALLELMQAEAATVGPLTC